LPAQLIDTHTPKTVRDSARIVPTRQTPSRPRMPRTSDRPASQTEPTTTNGANEKASLPNPGLAPAAFYDLDFCPMRNGLEGLLGKWPLLVITHLSFGKHRYNELRGAVPDISQRMLSKTLSALVRKGLVSRTQHRAMPPHVDYALTSSGIDFLSVLEPLLHWGLQHEQTGKPHPLADQNTT